MKKILTVLTILLIAGCMTKHKIVAPEGGVTKEKVASITKGVTTIAELEKMFGAPEMALSRKDGTKLLFKDLNLRSVVVVVDQNDVVSDYTWSE